MQTQVLKKHHLNSENHKVECAWSISQDSVLVQFTVFNYDSPNINPSYSQDYKENWGLWEHDVVEIFIKKEGSRYLELQVSPLNQAFALIIEKPRVDFNPPKELNTHISCEMTKDWVAIFKIPLSEIPGSGNKLYGNFFSCLGSDTRSYYALNINTEDTPDFHRPDLFIKLGELE